MNNRVDKERMFWYNKNRKKNVCSGRQKPDRKEKINTMKLTRNNLNEVLFENHDARLLIEDVVSHTQAGIYYYHDVEITLQAALKIWNRVRPRITRLSLSLNVNAGRRPPGVRPCKSPIFWQVKLFVQNAHSTCNFPTLLVKYPHRLKY